MTRPYTRRTDTSRRHSTAPRRRRSRHHQRSTSTSSRCARLTQAMVAIEGEGMRKLTWCVVEEIRSGDWGIGGHTITRDDVKALARASEMQP
jgi:hypothetical protein